MTLRFEPGTTVRMASGTRIDVYGTLTAVGTASSPITFTSTLLGHKDVSTTMIYTHVL